MIPQETITLTPLGGVVETLLDDELSDILVGCVDREFQSFTTDIFLELEFDLKKLHPKWLFKLGWLPKEELDAILHEIDLEFYAKCNFCLIKNAEVTLPKAWDWERELYGDVGAIE